MAYLWGGMLLIGIVYGVLAGNVDEVTKAFVSCSGEAVSLCISMAGITAMWTGMMKIAEASGQVAGLADKMRPLIRFLFPKLDTESKAAHYICLNFLSNVLGLSWAFLIINVSSLQLIPVNMIAYRVKYGSADPTAIVGPAILATAVSTAVAVIFCKVVQNVKRLRN